jgi:two-component system OmpR family response regulator
MSNQQDHILIVDDDRDIRGLLADYLEKQGLRCTTAADGREMKAALERHRIDLIVLDLGRTASPCAATCAPPADRRRTRRS